MVFLATTLKEGVEACEELDHISCGVDRIRLMYLLITQVPGGHSCFELGY